jgi:hypothetical protein
LKIPLWDPVIGTRDSGIRITSANGSMPIKAPPLPTMWNWTGGYIGAHVGGALSTTDFSDPFGASAYGDTVRSPAFLGGGKIGYNWQAPGSRWVLGVAWMPYVGASVDQRLGFSDAQGPVPCNADAARGG